MYYQIFHHLEDIEVLDVNNERHVVCLHFVFVPRINRDLEEFRRMWNCHPLSSEKNMTPNQLWITGMQRFCERTLGEEMSEADLEEFGVEPHIEVPDGQWEETEVVVPQIVDFNDEEALKRMAEAIDPVSDDGNYGVSVYLRALEVAGTH